MRKEDALYSALMGLAAVGMAGIIIYTPMVEHERLERARLEQVQPDWYRFNSRKSGIAMQIPPRWTVDESPSWVVSTSTEMLDNNTRDPIAIFVASNIGKTPTSSEYKIPYDTFTMSNIIFSDPDARTITRQETVFQGKDALQIDYSFRNRKPLSGKEAKPQTGRTIFVVDDKQNMWALAAAAYTTEWNRMEPVIERVFDSIEFLEPKVVDPAGLEPATLKI